MDFNKINEFPVGITSRVPNQFVVGDKENSDNKKVGNW